MAKLGPDYVVLGKYINKTTKIKMKHLVCGNVFMKNPHDASYKGSGCPYCNGHKLYNEQWVKDNTPYPYQYIGGYNGISKKCTFYCSKCNQKFQQLPSRLIKEKIYGCGCCPTKKKTNEQFLLELGEECLQEYEVLEKYVSIDTPIKFKHKKCQTIFELSPYKFLYRHNKKYCPICYYKKSKGEIRIAKFLEKNNISYKREYRFPNSLKNRKFDFYLPEYNSCIEYDGEQHFRSVSFFGGEEAFEKTKERDKEKNIFCLENNITLYRIPYTDFDNIETILQQIYKEKSSTTIEKYKITE